MKQPGSELRHAGESFLCIEGGFNDEHRIVTVMARPDSPTFPAEPNTRPVTWRDQGEWFPIARWSANAPLHLQPPARGRAELVEEIVARHLEDRPLPPEQAWVVAEDEGFMGSLERVLPLGVAAHVHGERAAAVEQASGRPIVPVQSVALLLTHLAREGYAGAMWDSARPVYFCLDEHGDLQFLRVGRGDDGGVALEILETGDVWAPYEGAEEIEFLDNSDACDRRLVATLGARPPLGWPEDGRLWAVGPMPDEPGVVAVEDDTTAYGLLFTSAGAADSWCDEEAEELGETWVSFAVDDVRDYLSRDELTGCGGLLNPGEHRARRGVLWVDGQRAVLDCYSGFWSLDERGLLPIG